MCLWWLSGSGRVRGSARGPRAAGGRAEDLVASNVVGRSILDDKTMRLLKAMREQLGETSASRTVDAAAAANSLGLDRGTLDFHRSLHDLVRDDYLEEPPNPAPRARGKYLITFEGIAAADNH
jgi:hypothetical protein